MKVAIFGGTGFVGSYLVDELVAHNITPRLLVRPGHVGRAIHPDACEHVTGDLADPDAIDSTLSDTDAVIYNVGILRENRCAGATFEEMHFKAARRVMDAAERLGVKRFLLTSANGVRADGTAYQRTKHLAEAYLKGTQLDWTIVQPSVIFGDPRGRMELATQLYADIIRSPLPAPLFFPGLSIGQAGAFRMSPVAVSNVAEAFRIALQDDTSIGETLQLGGPEDLSWRTILTRIAAAADVDKLMLPVPAMGVSAVAALFERYERFPITRAQIQMLLEGNVCSSDVLHRFGIEPVAFDVHSLAYLNSRGQDKRTWHKSAA